MKSITSAGHSHTENVLLRIIKYSDWRWYGFNQAIVLKVLGLPDTSTTSKKIPRNGLRTFVSCPALSECDNILHNPVLQMGRLGKLKIFHVKATF